MTTTPVEDTPPDPDRPHPAQSRLTAAVVPVVAETVEKAVRLTLEATDKLGGKNPATVLVTVMGVIIIGLASAGVWQMWAKRNQDSEMSTSTARFIAELREDQRRLEDSRDRERSARDSASTQQLIQVVSMAEKATESQRETTRVMLMVKGAIDEFRSDTKRSQQMMNEFREETKKQRELLEKILECMKGKWKQDDTRAPAPRPASRPAVGHQDGAADGPHAPPGERGRDRVGHGVDEPEHGRRGVGREPAVDQFVRTHPAGQSDRRHPHHLPVVAAGVLDQPAGGDVGHLAGRRL